MAASSSCFHSRCLPFDQLRGDGACNKTTRVVECITGGNACGSQARPGALRKRVPVVCQRACLRVDLPRVHPPASVVASTLHIGKRRPTATCRSSGGVQTDKHVLAPSESGHFCRQGADGPSESGHFSRQGVVSTRRGSAMARNAGSDVIITNQTLSGEVLECLKNVNAVCFDVDSTVCTDEGIDELAAFCGSGEAVAAWTTRAMTGSVLFEDALAARLGIIRPSTKQLASFLSTNPPKLSDGIKEVVGLLHARGVHVYLISGGFRQMITPVASILGIPADRIFANLILFGENGEYSGFDRSEPTSRSGGKPLAIELLRKRHGYKKVVMVGDGATDLEARRPGAADFFIGYGGVQVRPKVAAGADWFITNFEELISVLKDISSEGAGSHS